MDSYFIVAVNINAHPSHGRFARYDQANSTHTNMTHGVNDDGGGEQESLFNNTIHLLDFLSQLIINQDPANNNSSTVDLTFEDTMGKLDAIIQELDEANVEPPPNQVKIPRLEMSDPDAIAKYEALVELKNMLDEQFSEYADNAKKEQRTQEAADQSMVFNDTERLKLPLVGVPNADPSNVPMNEQALNLLVKQGVNPGVAVYPVSDSDQLKDNITDLIGIDFDTLIEKVSQSVGEVNVPMRVEEHHTQVTEEEGMKPVYQYTETVADITPNEANLKDPNVNIVSKRFEKGDLLGTGPKTRLRWVPSQAQQPPIRGLGPTLEEIAASTSPSSNGDVKVNVTTKTNIVNVFTFNIFVNNGTDEERKNSFTLVKDAPLRSSIQTTANIGTNDGKAGKPLNSISLYQYQANDKRPESASSSQAGESGGDNGGAELEKWLKILMNHQAYGDGSNIVAEAVLKDASLQHIPEARTSMPSFYRRMDQEDTTSSPFPVLGYKTNMEGDILDSAQNVEDSAPRQKTLVESIVSSPLPTVLAGLAAVSPALLTVLGRRKRDVEEVDIPDQWLAYLLGTRYGSTTNKTPSTTPRIIEEKEPLPSKWAKYGSTAVKLSPDWDQIQPNVVSQKWTKVDPTTAKTTKWTKYDETTTTPMPMTTNSWKRYGGDTTAAQTVMSKRDVPKVIATTKSSVSLIQRRNEVKDVEMGEKTSSKKVENLMSHWTKLYNSVKTIRVPTRKVITTKAPTTTTTRRTTRGTTNRTTTRTTNRTTRRTTTTRTTTAASTTTEKSTTTTRRTPRTTAKPQSTTTRRSIFVPFTLKQRTTSAPQTTTTIQDAVWDIVSSSYPNLSKESFFPRDNPIKIIDEQVSTSTSTSTEINLIPRKEEDATPPPNMSFSQFKKKFDLSPPKTSDGRIKSTNVPPSLWLTAKDILHNLESKLFLNKESEKNDDMTNSPIVIIPVEEEAETPFVDVEALKPIAAKNPITFLNMNSMPKKTPAAPDFSRVPKPPSKLFVENFWSSRNNASIIRRGPDNTEDNSEKPKIITFSSSFPFETSTAGVRRPPWESKDEPNRGVGVVQELQVPPSVNIYSPVIKTNLTPEVIPNLMQKLSPPEEKKQESEAASENLEDYSPLSAPVKEESYAPLYTPPPTKESFAPLSPPSASYESYETVPNNKLIDTLKVQLQDSPIRHAINKGQWVYESTKQSFTKNSFHKGQLLEWIKNMEEDIQPTTTVKSTPSTSTASTTLKVTSSSPTESTSLKPSTTSKSPINVRLGLPVAPAAAVVVTVAPSTTTTTSLTTASNASPKTLGELVASAIAQSAAPLAGLSAATIAYGAAAMLPVWLPLALGKKRKRRRRSTFTNPRLTRAVSSSIYRSHNIYRNKY